MSPRHPTSTQRRATNGPPAIGHLNGLSLVGLWWPDVVRWPIAGGPLVARRCVLHAYVAGHALFHMLVFYQS